MRTLQFRCKLLSDIIINQKSATEGPNKTLDFIPGGNFLGIVATRYEEFGDNALEVFHSGKVRFGDAHPAEEGRSIRSLRIPASMFYPKLSKPTEGTYIHHLIPDIKSINSKQLKQCRTGFYSFDEISSCAKEIKVQKKFAIKSAYDKTCRRSQDQHMYQYQSLSKGLTLFFEVEVENDKLVNKIVESLIGIKRVGRSRTAQYGLVDIEECKFSNVPSGKSMSNIIAIYADSRLIFLDEYGMPTFQPKPKELGIDDKDADILWEYSQIRTFQYSPWNNHRQCHDADRCGIEKGSVFVVRSSESPDKSRYVGSYRNEGFGKVIYNPLFLQADKEGKALYNIISNTSEQDKTKKRKTDLQEEIGNLKQSSSTLLRYLGIQKEQESIEQDVYKKVNEWINKHESKFKEGTFASQWGTIRSIAMQHKTKEQLKQELFLKTKIKTKIDPTSEKQRDKTIPDAYLTHGIAAEKWEEKGRRKAFQDFVDKELTEENAQMAIINLAAEMAKRCKKGGKR